MHINLFPFGTSSDKLTNWNHYKFSTIFVSLFNSFKTMYEVEKKILLPYKRPAKEYANNKSKLL